MNAEKGRAGAPGEVSGPLKKTSNYKQRIIPSTRTSKLFSTTAGQILGELDDDIPSSSLLEFLRNHPHRTEGLNIWILKAAHRLRREGIFGAKAIALLESTLVNEPIKDGEIEKAVARAVGGWTGVTHKWPIVNRKRREEILHAGAGLAALREKSEYDFDGTENYCEWVIDQLFPGNPLLCVGKSKYVFRTRPREELRGDLANKSFIVPSPMNAQHGVTQDGKDSEHCLNNTGSRRFLIVEQDDGSLDEQASVILYLAEMAPLALVVHSGGKSLHSWFFCEGQTEEKLRHFMRLAVSIGADHATWCRSQFVRMPDGHRDTGKRQQIQFFNGEVIR